MKAFPASLFEFAVLAAVSSLAACSPAPKSEPVVGQAAPPLSAATIAGPHFDLVSLRGRWVVVNFFASWCEPCRQEGPALVRFTTEHDQRHDASVVGVVFEDSPTAAERLEHAEGGTWPLVADPTGSIGARYQVTALPQSFLIAPDGRVDRHIYGGVSAAELDATIAAGQPR